jgi:glycosyltransferase involved in cell wall biosynthesis
MRIVYPYNEILPRKKAHDVFIVNECAALSALGWDVNLLAGAGSEREKIFSHYQIAKQNPLRVQPLYIVRKNNPFRLSWNLPFFWNCQKVIRKERPDYVFLSVRKQAAFHLVRKIPGVRYLYEVHELCFYPNGLAANDHDLHLEKMALSQADLVTVTTEALKEILLNPPYSLKVPVEVVPLAVQAEPLPPPPSLATPLVVMYVGQLYAGQGIPTLLAALPQVSNVHLKIIGGTQEEITSLTNLAKDLKIVDAVEFLGFIPPSQIPSFAKNAHAFVAPFDNTGRMPYVAHTKLFEYVEWGRPVIAPDLPIVREHFPEGKGALLFEPNSPSSLAKCLSALKEETLLKKLQSEIHSLSGRYSWNTRAHHYAQLLGA